jgi:hypothetical protein
MTSRGFNSRSIRFLAAALALGFCAYLAPWWGTPIVVAACYIVFRLPTRVLSFVTLFAWVLASASRDYIGQYGPSRVFAKMLSIESIGFASHSIASRVCVYGIVGVTGFLLALFTGGILKSIAGMLPAKLFPQESLR